MQKPQPVLKVKTMKFTSLILINEQKAFAIRELTLYSDMNPNSTKVYFSNHPELIERTKQSRTIFSLTFP